MPAGLGADFAPRELIEALPVFGSVMDARADTLLRVKWFSPYKGITWYAAERVLRADRPGVGQCVYGPVVRDGDGSVRWQIFDLDALQRLTGMRGALPLVERDAHYTPTTLRALRKEGRA